MILSPLAPAFTPNTAQFAIYNNGVPCMVSAGKRGESEIIAGLSDEVLDIIFPLTAEDVAEMEECDAFVEVLATLSLLEDRESVYRARFDDFHSKRWEARREEGLVGRPHAVRNTIKPKKHFALGKHVESEKSIVKVDPSTKQSQMMQARHRSSADAKSMRVPSNMKRYASVTRPIVQPRKQY